MLGADELSLHMHGECREDYVYQLVVVGSFNVTGAPPNQLVAGLTNGISDTC